MAVRPNSKSLAVAQGKGISLPLAKVSAAMEAIEHWHAENASLEVVEATYRQLAARANVCDPRRLPQRQNSAYHEDLSLTWVRGRDLMSQRDIYVPYDVVHLRYMRYRDELPLFVRSSNGLASGNHLLEAMSHAACEVIERDATVLWELQREAPEQDETAVALESIDSPACRELIDRIERAGLFLHVWNQTSNTGIPSFAAVIAEKQGEALRKRRGSFGGYGCHLSKEIALLRAITEAAQSRLTQISGARDDLYRSGYERQQQSALYQEFWRTAREQSKPSIDFSALPSLATDSLDGDVSLLLEQLRQAGFDQFITVDLSDPRFDIAVVKVIIPDAEFKMEGMQHRYGRRAREQTLRALISRHLFGEAS
jgi:ribosomal protein S12 methylthiotransferase accessory factor